MGKKINLVNWCRCPLLCSCLGNMSDSYDIRDLPRPPTNETDNNNQGVLVVQGLDLCNEKNGEKHHTNNYKLMTREVNKCLVVRRGQAFKIDLLLNRPYDASKDAISFIFYDADTKKRVPSDDTTTVAVPLLDKESEIQGGWNALYEGQKDSRLMVSITPAADCVVAAWCIDVDTKLKSGAESLSYTHPQPIYILFNPWCLKDQVYMSDDSHREEFVQESGGMMFRGVYNMIKPMAWDYSQYEKDILECALYLVRVIGKVKGRSGSDPVQVSRALSAAINVQDDSGVLYGQWSANMNDYKDGTHPFEWVGSLEILQKYFEKKKSVKYAQCWVYAGVMTTICRALGIPCRPVTGFNAAHDREGSLTIDFILNEDDPVKPKEFIWNYHVWNEAWMDRPDLGSDYGGWQVIDATPQEQSENIYRCGPASLKAIHNGDLKKPYDAAYVFAQVNADQLWWKYSGKDLPYKLVARDTTSVGRKISTKVVGKMEREDITDNYKCPEHTREERAIMEKALLTSNNKFARYYRNEDINDVVFDFELKDDVIIGQNFNVVLHIENQSPVNKHQVRGSLRVDTVTYTGVRGSGVKSQEFDISLAPEAKERVELLVTFDEYYKKLIDHASFNISCSARIEDKDFDHYGQDDFRVRNPDIKISIDGTPRSRQEFAVTARVENPLPIPLKSGKFYIQGPGLEKQLMIKLPQDVAPGAIVEATFKLTAPWAGRHQITAKFFSKELSDVDGFLSFIVG